MIRYAAEVKDPPPPDAGRCSVTDPYGRRCVLRVHHDEPLCVALKVPPVNQGPAYGAAQTVKGRRTDQ